MDISRRIQISCFSSGSESELQYSDIAEAVEESGGKIAEKKEKHGKKKPPLNRQDTFVLISPSMPKKSSQRAKVYNSYFYHILETFSNRFYQTIVQNINRHGGTKKKRGIWRKTFKTRSLKSPMNMKHSNCAVSVHNNLFPSY